MAKPPASPANRLMHAASPYLRQHAHNPVDWYPWGREALERAQRENKPIFLSIGYAACHWCHVMAHESFADPSLAAVLNEHFVNIKVDREERPDLDEIYMQATLALNQGQGGWPMSVWLTPELKPFFAGTYFPPHARWGQPGFREICQKISEAWRQHQADIVAQAEQLAEIVRQTLQPAAAVEGRLTLATVDGAAERLAGAFDTVSGGMVSGTTNKFPPAMALDVLLRSAARRRAEDPKRKELLDLVELTLDRMAGGGIYDQLGGGVHRYSTDVEWRVPHFEKMLYDQALVSRAYVDAWQVFRKPLYARSARGILDYVLTDLQARGGGFYSSRDADSEGVEGKYYVWTKAEVIDALGTPDGELFCAHYDVREHGNWRDPHDADTPKNVLHELRDYHCCGKFYGISAEECAERLRGAREKLLNIRAQRVPPALDDKILCEWNGLMISALARGGSALGAPEYAQAARRAADFLLTHQYVHGRLSRSYREGQTLGTAFLTDYSALIEGLLELYEATFEPRWLTTAGELHRTVIDLFWDDAGGCFSLTARDHEPLIARNRDLRDGSTPSGNSLALMNLLRLAAITGAADLRAQAERLMTTFAGEVLGSPWSSERFMAGVDFAHAGPQEVMVVGARDDSRTAELIRQVYETYLPNRVFLFQDPAKPDGGSAARRLAERTLNNGEPTAFVCGRGTCRPGVNTVVALAHELGAVSSGG